MYANLRLRAAVRLAGLRPHADNPALRAWRSHKKPPAEAGGLRVASLPACHAKRVRTGKLRAVIRHGRRGGFRARSPRVSTRGFLCGCQARRAGLIPSGRRPAKRTAARGRGFACSMPPGFHPGLLGPRAPFTQKAPGGSRGTPGRIPSRLPCEAGSNREIACRHPAWTAGWFSCPDSPGFHPGLLGRLKKPSPNSKDLQNNVRNRVDTPAMRCRASQHDPQRGRPAARWASASTIAPTPSAAPAAI